MKNKLLISFLIFLSLGASPAFCDEIEEATAFYNEAIDLYKQDNINQSVELFNKAIKLNPDFYEAHYNLAQILMSLEKNEEAVKILEETVKLKPDDTESLYNIGRLQYKRGNLSNAHKYLKQIPQTAPQYESAKILITKIEKRQGELNLENKIKEHKNLVDAQGKAKGVELAEVLAPSGTAVDSRGNIYVASFSENVIYKISIYGQKTVFSKSALIKGPIGLAIDKNDNIYIANYLANNVVKITPASVASVFANVEKPYCMIYVTENNRIYVTEQNTNKLIKFDL